MIHLTKNRRTFMAKGKQGFASLSPEERSKIARIGGQSQGKKNNPGNFANNIDKARHAGKLGGRVSRRKNVSVEEVKLPLESSK
jgi:general stress protein YciG